MDDSDRLGRYAPFVAEPETRKPKIAATSERVVRATRGADLVGAAGLAARREQGSREDWLATLSGYLEQDDRAMFIAQDIRTSRVSGYGLVRELTLDDRTVPN